MKRTLLLIILFCTTAHLFGQQFWNKKDVTSVKAKSDNINFRKSTPKNYNIYSLDLNKFSSFLKSAKSKNIIELPNAQGVMKKFYVRESSNFAPELSTKFPMIHSYTGYGIDDPTAMAKIDLGTKGFHAIVFSGKSSTLYIDPYTKDGRLYVVYQRKDLNDNDREFLCEVEESKGIKSKAIYSSALRNANDGVLRTFRIAIVTTGEYSQYHLNQQGVSSGATDAVKKAAILSAINTTMNRVNGVFERDLGVHMNLVANNEDIIFLDATTDNLSNNDANDLIDESQSKCDTQIGSANYDIGHAFSTGAGGLAGLGVVCNNSRKGQGVTGQGNPINDPFDIDYVAHELGHQFGANHTQNNDCQRNSATAVEPGSASTIMGYAGICLPNVQNNSDDHFHAVSIAEMWNILQTSGCSVNTSTGNSAPTADAGDDVSIPKSTPFVLRGIATDANGLSSLTYNWEQMDNEIGSMPPSSTNSQGPMFRSLSSKTVPERYMPELATVIAGNTSTTWEVLPSVARNMEFAFTVRDNHPGGGNSARDDKVVTVVDVDPFTVTSQNRSVIYLVGSTQTIQWNKGSTDVAPINCQTVTIKLSTDGGNTFPITILANTPNDGTQDIVIPNNVTSSARIMVEATDNIFYNVNATNFTIQFSTPTFIATNTTGSLNACNTGNPNVVYNLDLDFIGGFSETVSFSSSELPSGSQLNFSPTTINSAGSVLATLSNFTGATPQNYTIVVTATSATVNRQVDLPFILYDANFSSINLSAPPNGDSVTNTPTLNWSEDTNATAYELEVATDNRFSNIVFSTDVTTNTFTFTTPLSDKTQYFWRVKPKNNCGQGNYSNVGDFQTGCSYCTSNGNTSYNTSITLVSFNTINNASTKGGGYEDNTGISTIVQRGESYDLTVNVNTDGNYITHTKVWIDWNQNCTFDSNEEYDLGTARNTLNGATTASPLSVTVPNEAVFGTTRMRVSNRYDLDPTVCDTSYDGEVEDYSIVVDNPASVEENTLKNFRMFPNPSLGALTIKFDMETSNQVDIQLYDVRGRSVKTFSYINSAENFSETIDVSGMSSGIYLLKIQNGNKTTVKKFIMN